MEPDPSTVAEGIPEGTHAEAETIVQADHLAPGRGVFSTPRMIALMERASSEALAPLLPEGWTSVGTEVCVKHLAATPPGQRVVARAVVISRQGRRIRLSVEAFNASRKIGEGTHERALVQLAAFQQAAQEQSASGDAEG